MAIYLVCKDMRIANERQKEIDETNLPYGVKAIGINQTIFDGLRVLDIVLDESISTFEMTDKQLRNWRVLECSIGKLAETPESKVTLDYLNKKYGGNAY